LALAAVHDALFVAVRVVLARADAEDDARPVACADDRVARPGRAVHEIPWAKRPLLALDDEDGLAEKDEEVLLVALPAVHRHRLSRPEHVEADPELVEASAALEPRLKSAALEVEPGRVADVDDEPAVADCAD